MAVDGNVVGVLEFALRGAIVVNRIVTLMFVGLVLGFLLTYALIQGFFAGWQALPSSPTRFVALTTLAEGKIYARTADGASYSCPRWEERWEEACWTQEPVPAAPQNTQLAVSPNTCAAGSTLRFRLTHPG